MIRPLLATVVALGLAPAARAIVFRSYSAPDHQRFDPFPANPGINPDQLFAELNLTGIGWLANYPGIQFALVSRQHLVFANHFKGVLNGQLRFLSSDGTVVSRSRQSVTVIQDGGADSDLVLVTLSSPLDAATGIAPLPYLDLPGTGDHTGLPIGVAGIRDESGGAVFPVIGAGTIAEVETTSRTEDYGPTGFLTNRYLRFDDNASGFDVHFEVGDSGSPSFVPAGGRAAIVGVHSYVEQPVPAKDTFRNYDVFVPRYVAELDAILATAGYRMRPVNAAATTLADGTATAQSTPRRAMPLTFTYTLTNSGAHDTGNLEVEFHFAPAEAPDSLPPPAGWVSAGSGPSWTFRRALLTAGGDATFTAHWAAAPPVASIAPGIVRRSDTTADAMPAIAIPLAPSFAEWAAGLPAAGENDDPDGDRLPNVLEYALGGDPENGVLAFADGGPLVPAVNVSAGTVTLTHPERDDKEARGLGYIHEFSDSLGGWSDTLPPGFSTSVEPYDPVVPGFVKRVLHWPAGPGRRFARLRVELDE